MNKNKYTVRLTVHYDVELEAKDKLDAGNKALSYWKQYQTYVNALYPSGKPSIEIQN